MVTLDVIQYCMHAHTLTAVATTLVLMRCVAVALGSNLPYKPPATPAPSWSHLAHIA